MFALRNWTLVGVALSLTGCGVIKDTCNEPQRYETAQVAAALKIPEGLTAPPAKGSLIIPDVPAERKKLTSKDACRDAPPLFATDKPPVAK